MALFHQLRFTFAGRLAVFYAALFVLTGVQLPFFPVWLRAKGLDAGLIGVVLAVPMVVRVLAIPLATRMADRHDALRAGLMLACAASLAGYVLLGFASGAAAVLITFALLSLAFTPVMPLADTYAMKGLTAHGRAYGPVRLWGSAAFIAGTFTAGFASDVIPARDLIWLIVAASFGLALAGLGLAPLPGAHDAAPPRRRSRGAGCCAIRHSCWSGRGGADPGQPCGLLRLLVARMARRRPRRRRHRRLVGARRHRRDRTVRAAGAAAAVLPADGAADGGRTWRRRALGRYGARSVRRRAAVPAGAARVCRSAPPISARSPSSPATRRRGRALPRKAISPSRSGWRWRRRWGWPAGSMGRSAAPPMRRWR